MSSHLVPRSVRPVLAAGVLSFLLVPPASRGPDRLAADPTTSPSHQDFAAKSCKPLPSVTVQIEPDRTAENAWSLSVRNAGPAIESVVSIATGIDQELAGRRVVWEGALLAGEEHVMRLEYAPAPGGDCVLAMIESGDAPGLVLRHVDATDLRRGANPKQRRRDEVATANGEQILQFIGSQEVAR